MPIIALSKETKELLGSTSIITTPVSLVKELVDNAIDAHADTIEILVSQNTLDKIEVRDNGLGIHPDDYDSLGRRGHTSKLKDFEALQTLAGSTLGFRGEALASANTVASLIVTTKTATDPVATILHINPGEGGVLNQLRGSAPVGTTVSVTQLYHGIPVREQLLRKDAKKTLENIKGLLRSYAMAKPWIRIAFKVIGKHSMTWTYAPKRNASYSEVILQILGKDVASRCLEKTTNIPVSYDGQHTDRHINSSGGQSYIFSTSMWKPQASFLRLPKHRYFSVDGRPVTGTRGIMQKLMSVYSKYLGNALGGDHDSKVLCDAFIRVDIKCPKGTYDVNMEPAKDQVLFEDEQVIVANFQALCETYYGTVYTTIKCPPELQPETISTSSSSSQVHVASIPPIDEVSSGDKGPTKGPLHDAATSSQQLTDISIDRLKQLPVSNKVGQAQGISAQKRQATPFTSRWAAVNARSTNQQPGDNAHPLEPNLNGTDQGFQIPEMRSDRAEDLGQWVSESNLNRRPAVSHQENGPETLPSQGHGVPSRDPFSFCSASKLNALGGRRSGTDAPVLPNTCQNGSTGHSMTPEPGIFRHHGAPPADLAIPPGMRFTQRHDDGNQIPNAVPINLHQSPMPYLATQAQQRLSIPIRRQAQLPWTPPSSIRKDQEQWHDRYETKPGVGFDGLKQTTISFKGSHHKPKTQYTPADGNVPTPNGTAGYRDRQRHITQASTFQEDSQNHAGVFHEKTITELRPTNTHTEKDSMADKQPISTSLLSGDPRAYLLRRQKSMATDQLMGRPKRFRRMKSMLLPLEIVDVSGYTLDLSLSLHVDVVQLPASLDYLRIYDKYILEADIEEALDMDLSEARRVEHRLNALLSDLSEALGERMVVASNLTLLLRGKAAEVRS